MNVYFLGKPGESLGKNTCKNYFTNSGRRLSAPQRMKCAGAQPLRFAKPRFRRHNFSTLMKRNAGKDPGMGRTFQEVGVLVSGLLCGAGFTVIALALAGVLH